MPLRSAGVEIRWDEGIRELRSLWHWLKKPELHFPKAFKINRRSYWKVADLDAWDCANGSDVNEVVQEAHGRPVVSGIIQTYEEFVQAMRARREAIKLPAMEADALGGLQEGYTNKLENYPRHYGRGVGPEVFPLWLGGLRVGIVLVDLPTRPNLKRKGRKLDEAAAA